MGKTYLIDELEYLELVSTSNRLIDAAKSYKIKFELERKHRGELEQENLRYRKIISDIDSSLVLEEVVEDCKRKNEEFKLKLIEKLPYHPFYN